MMKQKDLTLKSCIPRFVLSDNYKVLVVLNPPKDFQRKNIILSLCIIIIRMFVCSPSQTFCQKMLSIKNSVQLIGRLGAAPQIIQTDSPDTKMKV